MVARPRIAVGGLHVECAARSPVPTRASDFAPREGEALLDAPAFRSLRDAPAEVVPLLHARALPGGPVVPQFEIRRP